MIFDTSSLELEKANLEEELNLVAEQINDLTAENTRKVQNQEDYKIRYTSLVTRFNTTKTRLEEVSTEILERKSKKETVELFIKDLEKQGIIFEFDKNV